MECRTIANESEIYLKDFLTLGYLKIITITPLKKQH